MVKVDVWKRLDSLIPSDPGITVAEYAARYKVTLSSAQGKLERLTSAGTMVKGKRSERGRVVNVFRFPE